MKNLFPGFYTPNKSDFSKLWGNATFIFDTNVLLNLYRYQSSTRDELLNFIEKLSSKVWIPYHVALEYQRNRLVVISSQHKRYSEVRKIVESSINDLEKGLESLQLKKRHSHIDPENFIKKLKTESEIYLQDLIALEGKRICF